MLIVEIATIYRQISV